jgi:CO/xanthine dehydrogenase Mo-binding subunit
VVALERMIDMAARELSLDPIEMRKRNALEQGKEPG